MVFTTRFSGGRGGRNGLETDLRRLGIRQKNGRPNHPQNPGESGAVPGDPQELAPGPARPARHPRPAPGPPGHLHRRLQPPAAAPLPAPSRHPGHRLRRPAPKPPRATGPPTPPEPRPHRPARLQRMRHPARPRPSPPTSASAGPMPEPASCCSSRTCTSASSTPPPANSSGNSPSTPPATTSPPAAHLALSLEPPADGKTPNPNVGSGSFRCLATSQIRKPGVRTYFIRQRRDRPPALPSSRTRCRQGCRHRARTDAGSRE